MIRLTHEEVETARSGRRLLAIKLVRERTGCGLTEGRAAVDAAVPRQIEVPCPFCYGRGKVEEGVLKSIPHSPR